MALIAQALNVTVHTEPCDIQEEFRLSKNTSISRKSPAAPLKRLIDMGLIQGRSINFAKGKEKLSQDTLAIEKATGRQCSEYDINWFNNPDALLCTYDSVYCGYCVNVLPPAARAVVWEQLSKLVDSESGVVFVAARTDKDVASIKTGIPCFDGVRTATRKTFQHGYAPNELGNEASNYFVYCEELVVSSDFRLVRCSHAPLPQI